MRMANRGLPFVSIEHNRLYPPKNSCASTLDWISQFGRKMQADIQSVDTTYVAVNTGQRRPVRQDQGLAAAPRHRRMPAEIADAVHILRGQHADHAGRLTARTVSTLTMRA